MPTPTQSAQAILLRTVESLLEEDEIDKALEVLLDLDEKSQAGLRNDLIAVSGGYRRATKEFKVNRTITFEQYSISVNQARVGLLELMKSIPKRVATNAQLRNVNTYQFEVPDDARLEKIIGTRNNLLRISWLEKALNASKAVCRVVRADGGLGTGFLTKDGYVFTNNHVLDDASIVAGAWIEFNYQQDINGKVLSRSRYQLDATDFQHSKPNQFDFARVKVIDNPSDPLRQWGFVEIDPTAIPVVGDPLTIIQHPKGEDKQIALNSNDVLSVWNQYVFYQTDTDEGSSGSPVFNKDWKVVALHHAGRGENEGGIQINAAGEKRPANRGILFRDIVKALQGAKVNLSAPVGGGNESFTPPPTPTPTVETNSGGVLESTPPVTNVTPPAPTPATPVVITPQQPTVSPQPSPHPSAGPVRFVVLYDEADAGRFEQLTRQLTVSIKITKKMVVYDVHKPPTGIEKGLSADQEIAQADYLLCLVSPNLFNGEADWLVRALTAKEEGHRVVPILLDHAADYTSTDLSKLASLPTRGRTLTDFPNAEAAYADIANEIKKLPKRI